MKPIDKKRLTELAKLASGSLYDNADPALIPF